MNSDNLTIWRLSFVLRKEQTKALVDSGATINFVDRVVIENNNLEMHKLANPLSQKSDY